jgi:hypothetical protein
MPAYHPFKEDISVQKRTFHFALAVAVYSFLQAKTNYYETGNTKSFATKT